MRNYILIFVGLVSKHNHKISILAAQSWFFILIIPFLNHFTRAGSLSFTHFLYKPCWCSAIWRSSGLSRGFRASDVVVFLFVWKMLMVKSFECAENTCAVSLSYARYTLFYAFFGEIMNRQKYHQRLVCGKRHVRGELKLGSFLCFRSLHRFVSNSTEFILHLPSITPNNTQWRRL